ncbi:hypothetical protein HanRHA438_Chr10g0449211 [Helianthus annuus]|nr:hypothetical protein HanRHA438_Chr10g0449211 [Helianthus annuus]
MFDEFNMVFLLLDTFSAKVSRIVVWKFLVEGVFLCLAISFMTCIERSLITFISSSWNSNWCLDC